ncbi:hypothetical protein MKZ38_003595 [Zalerion maritima]|uniref:Uncharacterized protein n=1 Tax=Zalerion maritima TaxID=339359 RepID=A0AAD5RMJ7_9PEZI|nr:hypothetical protein MKZ38_003595 [Zalerion maritima]
MGLFKFFMKTEKSIRDPLIAQAYNTTAPASPPLKGKTPVRGNGPISLQTLQETYARKAESSVVSLALDNEASAPPPVVPRFRETPERPTTASHSHSGSSSRPVSRARRESILGPPLSFKTPKAESYMPHKQLPFESNHSHRMTIGYAPPAQAPEPELHGGDRTISLQSNGTTSTRHFVDILDAQSELKPTNFHTRVKAAGVRDYGEDVADRNIVETTVDVLSPQASIFYASGGESAPSPIVARTTHRDEDLLKKGRRPHSRASRTFSMKSRASEFAHIRHERPFQSVPTVKIALESPARLNHRMSLASYIPYPPTESPQPRRRHRSESMYITSTARDADFLNELAEQLRPKTSSDRSCLPAQENLAALADLMATKPPQEFREKKSAHRSKKKSISKSTTGEKSISKSTTGAATAYLSPGEQPPVPSKRPSLHKSASSLASTTPDKTPTKRTSAASLKALGDGELGVSIRDSRLILQVCDPVENQATEALVEYHAEDGEADDEGPAIPNDHETFDDTDDGACPPPSIMTSSAHQHSTQTSHGSFNRTRASLLASPATSERLDEIIYEQLPNKKSEVRQWSISSTTTPPTTVSSAASMRPQSGHTPSTSLDAGQKPQYMSGIAHKKLPSLNMSAANGRPYSVASASVHMPHSPLSAITNFNIDDYISSDDDESDPQGLWRPRGEGEEELLFSDVGYGSMQLPGLLDSVSQAQSGDTGTATPVPTEGEGEETNSTEDAFRSSKQDIVTDPWSQNSGSSPLLSLLVPQAPTHVQEPLMGGRIGSLRHASSAPAVRKHSAFGGPSYSSSEYAEEGSMGGSRPSTSWNSRSTSQGASSSIPPIPPRRRPTSIVVSGDPIPRVSEESDESSGSESASDFEEEDRHFRAEFARNLEAGQNGCSSLFVPPSLHPHHGPVLRIPIPVKPSTPDTRRPTLPAHQSDEDNCLLPVHQIQMPNARRNTHGSVTHALKHIRYSPAIMHSSSSESLCDDDDDAVAPPDVPRSRPVSQNSPHIQISEEKENIPPLPQGYAYGHGGAKYGNGYGYIKVLPEHGGKGSLPGTPVDEKDGFFGGKGKKLVKGSVSRRDSRGSIHSDRTREIVRRLKHKVGDE